MKNPFEFEESTPQEVSRRTVVRGAAWSVPVIAVAVAAPAAAASTGTTVEADIVLSPVGKCGRVSGARFRVRSQPGNVPVPNASLVVTLPAGFVWEDDGSTGARTITANASGVASIPDITATSIPGDYMISAQLLPSGQTSNIPIKITGAIAGEYNSTGTRRTLPGIDENSTAVGWNLFLTPTGDLYWYDNSASPSKYHLVDSGVTSAKGQHFNGPEGSTEIEVELVSYTAGGVAKSWRRALSAQAGVTTTYTSVPAGAEAVGWDTFLVPGGNLYYKDTVIATGVTSATGQREDDSAGSVYEWITYVDSTGGHTARGNGTTATVVNNFPLLAGLNATAVGWNTFLAANGDLYQYTGTSPITKIASNVASAYAQHTSGGNVDRDMVTYVDTAGIGRWRNNASAPWQTQNVGVGATAEGWKTFLGVDERLWLGNQVLATGVQSANGYHEETGTQDQEVDWVAWTQMAPCV